MCQQKKNRRLPMPKKYERMQIIHIHQLCKLLHEPSFVLLLEPPKTPEEALSGEFDLRDIIAQLRRAEGSEDL